MLLLLGAVVQHEDARPLLVGDDLGVALKEDFLAVALVEAETVAAQPASSLLLLSGVGAAVVVGLEVVQQQSLLLAG